MLFSFLKYLAPTWYFNISSERSRQLPYFVDYRTLTEEERSLLDICGVYSTQEAVTADAAYQAFHKGLIKKTFIGMTMTACIDNVADNYIFIRRYFSKLYSLYVLGIRMLSFHNPVKECSGYIKARKTKRVLVFNNNYQKQFSEVYENFNSLLLQQQPMVSVIIPTLNRYSYLRDVLRDLEDQDYKHFEVIVCDQSEPVDRAFYSGWKLNLRLICQEEKALWLARNRSIRESKGEYIALSEDDVRVKSNWISEHLKCIDFYQADISAGVFFPIGTTIPLNKSFPKYAEQFASGNAMFRKSIMQVTGMFDRQFEKQRGGDGEYGLRAYLSGLLSVSNSYAYCEDVKAPSGGLRQMGSWDSFRPQKLFAPRPVPSVLYCARKYFGRHLARLMLMQQVPLSLLPYRLKDKRFFTFCSIFVSVVFFPIPLIQVCRSWRLATIKLKQGTIIEHFE